jgi:SAM-dependent methyltransferase
MRREGHFRGRDEHSAAFPKRIEPLGSWFDDITFREANAEQLPFGAGVFDAVVSNFTVHHLARPEVVFREVSRVLEPGGRFAFVVWGAPEAQSSFAAFFAAVAAHYTLDALPHGPLFGVTERSVYEPMLTGAGLTDCELSMHEIFWRIDGLESALRGWWDWGHLGALPQDVQDRIEATTRENAQRYEQRGRFEFPHTILLGIAVKRD